MSLKEGVTDIQISKVEVRSEPSSPGSPGSQISSSHRSEIRLRLSKLMNLTEVAEVTNGTHQMNGDIDSNKDIVVRSDGEKEWSNLYESVLQQELGADAYAEAMERQKKLFKRCCQEGSIIKDVGIYLKEEKLKALTGLRSLRMRLKSSQGIGLTGYAVMENNPLVSHDPFFTPGKVIEVTAVHSNYPFCEDDATICTRTLGLKFSLHPSTSPLDLMLHTGNISPAFNADAIQEYANAMVDEDARKKYLLNLPVNLQAYIEGVRAAPSSYYHQHYNSQVTYDLKKSDGVLSPCRFRIIPADGSVESGRLTAQQQRVPWRVGRAANDNRPPDYLKKEISHRLACGPLRYSLQVQTPDETQTHLCHMHYNPAIPWTNIFHCWSTIATITLTHTLPDEATELVRYNIANLPACFSLPYVQSNEDFNLVPYILKDTCDSVDRLIPVTPPPDKPITDDDTDYLIYILTSLRPDAGDDTDVTISIIGSEGRTPFRKVHQAWQDDLNRGNKRTYVLTDRPVGDILCLKVYCNREKTCLLKSATATDWLVESVVVATPYNSKCYSFPGNVWIPSRKVVTLRDGKALLPRMENLPLLRLERKLELQDAKQCYKWREVDSKDPYFGLPGHLSVGANTSALPKDLMWEGFSSVEADWINHNKLSVSTIRKLKRSLSGYLTYKKSNVLDPYIGLVVDLVEEHPGLYQSMKLWASDEEFGRLMLNGSNACTLQRITEFPHDFLLKPSDLDLYVDDGTFQDMLQAGRVYMSSYPALKPLETTDLIKRERLLCAPRAIFYMPKEHNTLLPLAIHLNYGDQEHMPPAVYTPSDDVGNPSPWLLAKFWVRCAEVHYHLLDSYLLKVVFMMEAVTIALLRNVSHVHPVYRLLLPYIRHAPALATLWRKVLLAPDGALAQVLSVGEHHDDMMELLQRLTSQASYSALYLPDDLTTRGVIDSSVLPRYYYREDGLKVCGAIRHHCAQVLDLYYWDDEDVSLDNELQDFLTDLRLNGLPSDKKLPPKFTTRTELYRFMTTVVYQSTAQSHALTSNLIDDMAFVPLSPPTLCKAAVEENSPEDDNPDGFAQLQQTLPSPHLSANYLGMIKLLSKTKTGAPLGSSMEKNFIEPNVTSARQTFKRNLGEIDESIEDRNKVILQPYKSLLPGQIPNTLKA